MIFLTLPELIRVAERVLDGDVKVRDYGLLESALARPRTTAFGRDAYPTLDGKAAALLHSLARNHALVDGNKRLALAGMIAFYGLNGRRLSFSNHRAYDLVIAVATGSLDGRRRHRCRPGGGYPITTLKLAGGRSGWVEPSSWRRAATVDSPPASVRWGGPTLTGGWAALDSTLNVSQRSGGTVRRREPRWRSVRSLWSIPRPWSPAGPVRSRVGTSTWPCRWRRQRSCS